MRVFTAIFLKEIVTFLRNWGLVIVLIYSFTLDVYIAGQGFEVKPRNVSVGYVDYSSGVISKKILSHLHSPEFKEPVRFNSQEELSRAIFNREIIVGLVFEPDFEKNFYEGKATLNILLDSTAAAQAYITLSYLRNIILRFYKYEIHVEIKTHKLFNQNADTRKFISFSEFLSIVTLIGVILSAVVFVREKENGTWDIMLLTPVDPKLIILAKTFSQMVIVMAGTVVSVGTVLFGVFDVPINGSFTVFILFTFAFLFAVTGIGLFIASVARSMLQVAQLSVVIMMPMIFLSGAWTPIHSMHPFIQYLSYISPLRYYIEGSLSIFFRGIHSSDLIPYFVALTVLSVALYIFGFRKIGKLF
ncbi:MAG TPA: ABC transporter permease [Persephonella sp.]|uniref:Multidrug ABC transporter, permease n=1 Tax=Persephonella marina (strain DSM 14350 / EX-H1) TaxID=123214 RepID=C0QPK2_PERMH|nr:MULTISPECIES: ABC transporter permease [Persephonella]ACO04772.1 multidrug ABC transporter, permease [Persephonella marina EX-H1]HCB69787.1 ABC transporter permease [Persephonella sp.]